MFHQTRSAHRSRVIREARSRGNQPKTRADVADDGSDSGLSCFLGELKTAFMMGFIIYLPFLVIDMVAASVLMAMGMMMLPPVVISLPFKIMLFVLVDGWTLLIGSLVKSFG